MRVFLPRLLNALLLCGCLAAATALRSQSTEFPQPQDPGTISFKVDAFSLGVAPDESAPNQYRALVLGNTTAYIGIVNGFDFEIGTQLFVRNTFATNGSDHTESGIGDVTLRAKWVFLKDGESREVAAVVPYIVLPTDSNAVGNNAVEGGVIVPWQVDVTNDFRIGAMAQVDILRNQANTSYTSRLYGSAFAKWKLGQRFGAYAETTLSDSTAGSGTASGTLGAGATLSLSKDFEWDFEMSRVLGSGRNGWTEVLRFRWTIL